MPCCICWSVPARSFPLNACGEPDCGLKTRGWPETEAALAHMVKAAHILRSRLSQLPWPHDDAALRQR